MPTYRFCFPGHPARINQLLGHWRKALRLKRCDRDVIGLSAKLAGVPPATGKRLVRTTIILGRGQRAGDPDAYFKSLLDALVSTQLLVDDRRQCVQLAPVEFSRGAKAETVVELEDVDDA